MPDKAEHWKNARDSMILNPVPNNADCNPEHPSKAESPMVCTLLGMEIPVNPVQFWNTPAVMTVVGLPPSVAGTAMFPEIGSAFVIRDPAGRRR
jgi:hypothetical protein